MFEFFYTTFMILCKAFAFYFTVISMFALLGKNKEIPVNKQLKFAALIAARNEESCITCIIDSLHHQDYPKHLLDIFVIPNNCTDNTSAVSKRAGATILSPPSTVKNKGSALQFSMNELLTHNEDYDAFIVFDADNEASPQFVSAMNQTLGNGFRVAKSRIFAKNQTVSWVATCYDIHFCIANLFLNRARIRVGLSARLIGTGFAVTSEYLREINGFNTSTIAEDAEFFAICAANGEKIGFSENAIT